MKILVIGGGASGLFAGGLLSNKGYDVTIIEQNEKFGKKIYITGKGRCNFTNLCSKEEFLSNVVNGQKFMMSAINQFGPEDAIEFFENHGMKTKVERGNRAFPISDKASDVTRTLQKYADGCKFIFNEKVKKITKNEFFEVKTDKNKYIFDKVIIATGGKSYPLTGSKGDGYNFAKDFALNIIEPKGALVPIRLKDKFCASLQGLSLKNVTLSAKNEKIKKSFFGEMLFTNDGISGPIALSLSSYINRENNIELSLDLKPALSLEQIEERLKRDFNQNLNKNISYVIRGLMPNSLGEVFLKCTGIDKDKKVNSITVTERKNIAQSLKNFKLSYDGLYPIETGIVTSGGVDLKEINPKTMECKKIKGLYFVGEVLNVDCLTGGFNMQTAFSTAFACANNIEE
jgi:hypothetical protein